MIIQTAGVVTLGDETIQFGHPIQTREAFVAAPVETMVQLQDVRIHPYTKVLTEDGVRWRDVQTGSLQCTNNSMSLGMNHLVSMPVDDIVVDGVLFVIGERMSRTQLVAAPVGTVILDGEDRERITKTGDETWYADRDGELPQGGLSSNYSLLASVPGFEVVPDPAVIPTLRVTMPEVSWGANATTITAASFTDTSGWSMSRPLRRRLLATLDGLKQSLGRGAIAMAQEYHKPLAPVLAAMKELGITIRPVANEWIQPGVGLPEGAVLSNGETGCDQFTMWLVRPDQIERVVGRLNLDEQERVYVLESPPSEEPVIEDEGVINAWKREVWEKGWQFKTENNWCSAYERLLRDHGITAELVGVEAPVHPGPFEAFPTMEWSEARLLPVGTVAARVGGDDHFRITIKGEGGWRRTPGSHTSFEVLRTHILHVGGGDLNIPASPGLLALLPAGSQVRTPANRVWEKGDDDTWTIDSGGRTLAVNSIAFNNEGSIIRIGHDRSEVAA